MRSLQDLIVFFDGQVIARFNIDLGIINSNRQIFLGNNMNGTLGFNGTIKQFRFINGNATDVLAYPIKEGDILT